jgi:hypothetical protein
MLRAPWEDLTRALAAALPEPPWAASIAALAGLLVSWWLYVPIHELLHALGCVATGGSVTRLEIGRWYGAALLQPVFPFVSVGSDYAGRLSGFDTRGSDLCYLATVFAPYLLTILVGVPLLQRALRGGHPGAGAAFRFGLLMPVAFAPFVNLLGDLYELGSIAVSRVAAAGAGADAARWRSDDLPLLVGTLWAEGAFAPFDVLVLGLSLALGTLGAFAMYAVGRWIGCRLAPVQRVSR